MFVLIFTGCTFSRVDDESVERIIDNVLLEDNKLYNVSLEGYKYYLPFGTRMVDKTDYNVVIQGGNEKYYLYIDVIKHYYNEMFQYEVNESSFYSKAIDKRNKFGYIEINEVNNKYFIELMYNYAKVEAYVLKDNLRKALVDISTILSSVKYNNVLLREYMDKSTDIYQEETFDIFKPKRETGNFLDYIEEYSIYDDGSMESDVDEDSLETID